METNLSLLAKINLLRTKIENIKVAMLTSRAEDNNLHSRPMYLAHLDDNGCMWFFTNEHTSKTEEAFIHPQVNLSFTDSENHVYVSVAGDASLHHDPEQIKILWNPMVRAWIPKGIEDPELALLCVNIRQVEYWDAPAGKMAQMLQAVKNAITGEEVGEHRKLDF